MDNQFTPDEVYDNDPADRLMHDIAPTLRTVQAQTTEALDFFPAIPRVAGSGADSGGGGESGSDDSEGSLTLPEFVYVPYNS